jgi:hypothetical protein
MVIPPDSSEKNRREIQQREYIPDPYAPQVFQRALFSELLGQNPTKQRKYAQAELLLRQALAFREKTDPDS